MKAFLSAKKKKKVDPLSNVVTLASVSDINIGVHFVQGNNCLLNTVVKWKFSSSHKRRNIKLQKRM
ncbi:hypothetical protein ACHAW6_008669 [Cyclotella cf. meneghiniana]